MEMDSDINGITVEKRLYFRKRFRCQTVLHGLIAVVFTVLGFVCVVKHDGRSNPPYFIGAFFVELFALTVFSALIYMNIPLIENDDDRRKDMRKWVYYYNALTISTLMAYILCIIIAGVKGITYGQKDDLTFNYYDVSEDVPEDPVADLNKKLAFTIVFSSLAGLAVHIYPVILSFKIASAFKVNLIKRRGLTGFRQNHMENTGTSTEGGHLTSDHADNSLIATSPSNTALPRPYEPFSLDLDPKAPPGAPPPSYAEVMERQ